MKKLIFVLLLSAFGLAMTTAAQGAGCMFDMEPLKPIKGLILYRVGSGSATIVGFSEYTTPTPSTPLKKYKNKSYSGTITFLNYADLLCQVPSDGLKFVYSGSDTIATNGALTLNGARAVYEGNSDNPPYVRTESAGGLSVPVYWMVAPDVVTKTIYTRMGSDWCNGGYYSGYGSRKQFGMISETLSDEDTEQDVLERAKTPAATALVNAPFAVYDSLNRPYAYETALATTFPNIGVKYVEYQAQFTITCPGDYEIVVTYEEKPHGANGPVATQRVVTRQKLESGTRTVEGRIQIEKKDTDYTITNITVGNPTCENDGAPGAPDIRVSSIHAGFGLGHTVSGLSSGQLVLETTTISAATYTPAALDAIAPLSSGVTIVRDAGNVLRQANAPQTFADIVTLDASSFEIRFYEPANVGTQDPITKIYAVAGTPYVTYKFENPDAAQSLTTRLRITETRGSNVRVSEYSYDTAGSTWSLSRGNGLRQETLVITTSGTDTTKTTTIRDENNLVVSKSSKTYRTFAWGEELISEVLDPDGAALTTSYDFYSNSATDGSN